MATIGERITKLRKELKLNQKQLAQKIDITEASLSRYENNLREPRAEIISKMSEILNCSTDYLLGLTDIKVHFLDLKSEGDNNRKFVNYKKAEEKIKNRLIEENILLDDEPITHDMLDKFFKYGMEATIEILKLEKKLQEKD